MTYCVGMLQREGLVMIADTRTNAGVDNINQFRKLQLFEKSGVAMALATSGNLSVTQSVVSLLTDGFENPDSGKTETLLDAESMFKAAQMVGSALRVVEKRDGGGLAQHGSTFDATILLGGQLKGGRLRLFMIYAAGNFIEATADTPFLQIGEHKYGKPVLDRAVTFDTEMYQALKLGLISMDSTMRSNLAVSLPLDIAVLRRDAINFELTYRIEHDDPYFADLRRRWSEALKAAHQAIPAPPYARRSS